ncbi:hypothetical protein Nepgr_007068 [Nepenthes gracilis]|uniref:Uncharacterized protein n=1 Tax=Nepenthes gracilis TaxID=150966 RepID=A0AAD3S693_NEPGR|nr:hypothetical protein Nepgr_007068 [Nepenthes gracilis]
MELFNGDCRLLSSSGAFPEGVAPFPQNSDLFYDQSPVIQPPGCGIRHHFPLQKLRPFRCNGRKMPGYANPMENDIITRNLSDSEMISRSHSFELGFLPQLPSSGFLGLHQQEIESGDVGGSAPGVSSPHPADGGAVPPVESETTEAGIMTNGLNGQISKYVYSSSPSNDTGNPAHDTEGPPSRKRKRKKENLEKFMENLMMQVINKQEQMHKQLIEMIEKKEAERVIREEAWKQQEMERAKREEEIRALETSRSLALISFIQNVLGHEIQIPQPLQACQEEDDGETQSQSDIKSDQTVGDGQNLKFKCS